LNKGQWKQNILLLLQCLPTKSSFTWFLKLLLHLWLVKESQIQTCRNKQEQISITIFCIDFDMTSFKSCSIWYCGIVIVSGLGNFFFLSLYKRYRIEKVLTVFPRWDTIIFIDVFQCFRSDSSDIALQFTRYQVRHCGTQSYSSVPNWESRDRRCVQPGITGTGSWPWLLSAQVLNMNVDDEYGSVHWQTATDLETSRSEQDNDPFATFDVQVW
jgi:hypothetical protein